MADIPHATFEATTSADFTFSVIIKDDDNEAVDISAATIRFTIRDRSDGVVKAIATGDSEITLPGGGTDGIFTILIPNEDMADVEPAEHKVGATMEQAGVVTQLFVGTLTVLDGVVEAA